MSIKNKFVEQSMNLASNPRVMKLMQDERFMKAMMTAMSVPGRVSTVAQDQTERFAKAMALATEQEVKDLRRTVRYLEEQLDELKKRVDGMSK